MQDAGLPTHPLLVALPAETSAALLAAHPPRAFVPDEKLLVEGAPADRIYLVLEGVVRVFYEQATGAEITAKMLAAPTFFGEAEALTGIAALETVQAATQGRVLELPVAEFEALLKAHAGFAYAVVRDVAARFAACIYQEKSLAFDPVTVRLANFLMDHIGFANGVGRAERIVLTQEEMAAAIGVSRRSITKDLGLWIELGVLAKSPRGYLVVRREELARYADPRRVSIHYTPQHGRGAR